MTTSIKTVTMKICDECGDEIKDSLMVTDSEQDWHFHIQCWLRTVTVTVT